MAKNETRAFLKLLFSISESLKKVAAHYELQHSTISEYSEYRGKIDNWYDKNFLQFCKEEGLDNDKGKTD